MGPFLRLCNSENNICIRLVICNGDIHLADRTLISYALMFLPILIMKVLNCRTLSTNVAY